MPDRSPLMSAANTGTPAAEICSAINCRVLVLPVPVAPATRPWRLSIDSGICTLASVTGWSASIRTPSSMAGSSKVYPSLIAWTCAGSSAVLGSFMPES